jgi:hypothetical protein
MTFDPGANREPKGIRAPGVQVPGRWSGTFTREGVKSFWNVSTPGDTIVIQLVDEHFDRLILTMSEPHTTVDQINSALQTS